jgi:hypothetical protein
VQKTDLRCFFDGEMMARFETVKHQVIPFFPRVRAHSLAERGATSPKTGTINASMISARSHQQEV